MCFIIFACMVSTLVWDVYGVEYGSYSYKGKYDSSSSYMTPQSAKAAMISMAVINFLVSLGFLVGTLSRSRFTQGCRFYFTVFASDIILAILQVSLATGKLCVFPSLFVTRVHSDLSLLHWAPLSLAQFYVQF